MAAVNEEESKVSMGEEEIQANSRMTGEKNTYLTEFLEYLQKKNNKSFVHQNVFSPEYANFISDLVLQHEYNANSLFFKDVLEIEKHLEPVALTEFKLLKTGIIYFLTSVFRDKYRRNIIKLLPALKQALIKNTPVCEWLIHNFTSKKVIIEFFLAHPLSEMIKFAMGLVVSAFRVVYEKEIKGDPKRLYQKEPKTGLPATITANFLHCCISLIFESKKAPCYSEFFKIFYDVARCGIEITQYLIKRQVIGRLLDFFFEKASPYNTFFRQMADVAYAENEKPEIGVMNEREKARTSLEEVLALKKEILALKKKDQQNEKGTSHREYLWQTLCYLVRHCRFNKQETTRSDWQIGELDLHIFPEEISLLKPETYFVLKVIEDCHRKTSINNITLFYSFLCHEDSDFTDTYAAAIKKGLDKAVTQLRPFFKALYTLAQLEDSLADKRCNLLCEMLCQIAKDNSNYYIETDAFISFVYKFTSRNKRAREWFLGHKDQWSWMVEWLHKNPIPSPRILKRGIKIQHRRLELREIRGHIALMTRRFENMLKNSIEKCEKEWDSDDDLEDYDFQVGQKIDYLDKSCNKWVTARIKAVLEEMLDIEYNDDHLWIARDNEYIAPQNTMQGRQKQLENEASNL